MLTVLAPCMAVTVTVCWTILQVCSHEKGLTGKPECQYRTLANNYK